MVFDPRRLLGYRDFGTSSNNVVLQAVKSTSLSYPFTLAVWYRPDDLSDAEDAGGICGFWDTAGPSSRCGMYQGSGGDFGYRAFQQFGSVVTATEAIGDNSGLWHCAIGLWSGSAVEIYNPGGSGSAGHAQTPTGTLQFATGRWNDSTPNLPFNGAIGCIGFWNEALQLPARTAIFKGANFLDVLPGSLRHYWRMVGVGREGELDMVGDLHLVTNSASSPTSITPTSIPGSGPLNGIAYPKRIIHPETPLYSPRSEVEQINRSPVTAAAGGLAIPVVSGGGVRPTRGARP